MLTPIKAIRAKCLDCCCGHVGEVRMCPSKNCPLYPYRMGKRPKREQDIGERMDEENTQDYPAVLMEE